MPCHRWSEAERERLDDLAGNYPFPTVPHRYNQWAVKTGYPRRTKSAIQQRVRRQRLTTRAYGEWLTTGAIGRVLGGGAGIARRWINAGDLPAKQHHRGRWRPWYVRRVDVVALARRRPELFGGIERGRLVQLLEDEALADEIAASHRRRANSPRRVRCVESGRWFPSIRDASRQAFVSRQLIQIAIRTGSRAAGYHWVTDADPMR